MLSWKKVFKKAAWGALPPVPSFVIVLLAKKAGMEISKLDAVELVAFLSVFLGALLGGGKNIAKHSRRSGSESEIEQRRRG